MGSHRRPSFNLNELPAEKDDESDNVLNILPQRSRASFNSRKTNLFAALEGSQGILKISSFSHDPSVSGFQPFARPEKANADLHVEQQASNHANLNVISSRIVVHDEDSKVSPLAAPVYGADVQLLKTEGGLSDEDGSADAPNTDPSNIKHEGVGGSNCGILEMFSVSSFDRAVETNSPGIKYTEVRKDDMVDICKDDSRTQASFGFDPQQPKFAPSSGHLSDGSVKCDTSIQSRQKSPLILKQRDIKKVEIVLALKSAHNSGKRHKLDHHKEAMLGKKRSRQTVFLNLKDTKQTGAVNTSSSRKQPLSSTLTSSSMKENRPIPAPFERTIERHGQFATNAKKHADRSSSEGITTMEFSDRISESTGDMKSGSSRVNNVNETSLPRQGSWKHPQDLRRLKNPPLLSRKPALGSENSENLKLGSKNLYPVKKQTMYNAHNQDTSVERLLREVTNDKSWHHPVETELWHVPGSFKSAEEYIRVFEPLLFEECRAHLYSTWKDQVEMGSGDAYVAVRIKRVDRRERGWYDVTVLPVCEFKWTFKEGDVAVLSASKTRRAKSKCDAAEKLELEASGCVTGLIRGHIPIDTCDPLGAILHFYVGDAYERNRKLDKDCVVRKLLQKGIWYLTILGTLATTQREYTALHAFQRLHLQMQTAILRPTKEHFPDYAEHPPAMPECLKANFVDHLHRSFNRPQLCAIRWAAMHTAADTTSGMSKRQAPWPFTLVQGPPGTGKTHTVWGMLNVIHLVQYQHYYTALLKKFAPRSYNQTSRSSSESVGTGLIDEIIRNMDQNLLCALPKLCAKPRMLVCTPSNAATTELLSRVLDRGFIDCELKIYRPNVAHVGVETRTRAAQAVSVEHRTEQLLGIGHEDIISRIKQLKSREAELAQKITFFQRELNVAAASVQYQGSVCVGSNILVDSDRRRDGVLKNLVAVVEARDKVLAEMFRLHMVERKFHSTSSFDLEVTRENLEASFAEEAEIVFTTVSSSGHKLFSRLTHGFDMVVIDEAAQASELGVLSPLSLGASHCVLVGDPEQLPAAVKSKVAGKSLYSRSLFERFQQAGCPTMLLSVQHRMHPQIRDFPSRYFYQGRLTESERVCNLQDEIYYKDILLRPYVFYNVTHGLESHSGDSVSYQNIYEAQFCLSLYEHLQKSLKSLGSSMVSVGIITPYELQRKCLQREFEVVLSSKEGKDLCINTVDAFQGQERDVIIISCVCASNRGVGFASDIRRMNVALTRARRALWVVGNAKSLMHSDDWGALITDAKSRNCYLDMKTLPKEFLRGKGTGYTQLPVQAFSDMLGLRTGGPSLRHFDTNPASKSTTPLEGNENSNTSSIPKNGGYRIFKPTLGILWIMLNICR